ncbi:hypothetical protein BDR26DRAFT_913835 [Obelidium mucronatum]|nr:hypothetical protein BDR26DRAFT_913835 [Obelidium mucronatum]
MGPPPVTLLRSTNNPQLFDASGNTTTLLSEANQVFFPTANTKLAANAPAGYKNYTLLALLFFLQEKNIDHTQYIQKSSAYWGSREVPSVSFVDRRDLLDYLTGVSESSAFVIADPATTTAAAATTDSNSASSAAVPKTGQKRHRDDEISTKLMDHKKDGANGGGHDDDDQGEALKKLKTEMELDFELIKNVVLAKERTIVNLGNFMSAKSTKSFTFAIKYAAEILRPGQISTTAAPVPGARPGSRPVDPKARVPSSSQHPSAVAAAKPATAPSKDVRQSSSKSTSAPPPPAAPSGARSSSKPTAKPSPNSKIPIIIVPPSVTSVITLYNAKGLLCDLKFQTTEEAVKSSQGDKPSMIILDRKNAPPGFPKTYHVYDSVDRLKTEDWDRIVAVFATGQEWQFKNWRFGAPVNIFSKVKGFCLKYVDEPVHEKIKTWNVIQLNHKHPRTAWSSSHCCSDGAHAAVPRATSPAAAAGRVADRAIGRRRPSLNPSLNAIEKHVGWTKHALRLGPGGRPTLVLAAEFHPWRVPDARRWSALLAAYKHAGFNAVRVYFHWADHSPARGRSRWDKHRDVRRLLDLCERIGLWLIAAPGPYICSETQGGGLPTWLLADKSVRARHSRADFDKPFDLNYAVLCREWFQAILPILAAHQITAKPNGCVILLQIENENFESLKGFPIGSADDMRFLARVARDCGITVPLFHNDGFEEGSWISHHDTTNTSTTTSKTSTGKESFGLDLYAFDKYVVFAPTSDPANIALNADSNKDFSKWKEWSPSTVEHAMDNMEKKVRGFGGCAATGPMFIAELQGGWFNHYTLGCSYDTIYDFYGEDYTRMIYDSSFAQGVTMINFYMGYGGTNWGTLGDPDVYTSYDYSACIREFGYISGRARKLRLALAFTRSFESVFVATDRVPLHLESVSVSPAKIKNVQRVSVGTTGPTAELTFMRNFTRTKVNEYTVKLKKRVGVVLKGVLEYKRSFIALGGYTSEASGLHLLFTTAPIHVRTHILVEGRRTEVWVIQNDSKLGGEMAFQGDVWVMRDHGGLGPVVRSIKDSKTSVVSFLGKSGWCALATPAAKENPDHVPSELLILALSEEELYTLIPTFEEPFWINEQDHGKLLHDVVSNNSSNDPLSLAWGAYNINHDVRNNKLEIEWQKSETRVYCLFSASAERLGTHGFKPSSSTLNPSHPLAGFPGLYVKDRSPAISQIAATYNPTAPQGQFHSWQSRTTDFESLPWHPLELTGSDSSIPSKDTLDLGFTSGHVLYKLTIDCTTATLSETRDLVLYLDTRHRCIVYLNKDHVVGGHTTYGLQIMKPGSKQGPDPFQDLQKYILPREKFLSQQQKDGNKNVIVYIVCESFGLNRQAFALNDVRNKRGIRHVKVFEEVKGGANGGGGRLWNSLFSKRVVQLELQVTGVDVKETNDPFNNCGFPDEDWGVGYLPLSSDESVAASGVGDASLAGVSVLSLGADKQPRWFVGKLKLLGGDKSVGSAAAVVRVPLRVHLSGPATAHIWIEGVYLVRYYGNGDSVQKDFLIPETYLEKQELSVKVLVYDGRNVGGNVADWIGLEKQKTKATVGANESKDFLSAIPTELFDFICEKLSAADVLTLACVNQRMAQLTTDKSRIWTILRTNLGFPAFPAGVEGRPTDKHILLLFYRVGCFYCPTRTKSIDWRALKRICSKCFPEHGKNRLVTTLDSKEMWARIVETQISNAEQIKHNIILRIKQQRKADIIKRFASMQPLPIGQDILERCDSFERMWNVARPMTDRVFKNVMKTLSSEILEVRVYREIILRFAQLKKDALTERGAPAIWHESFILNWDFLLSDSLAAGYYSFMGTTQKVVGPSPVDESVYYAVRNQWGLELYGYAWNLPFPAFDTTSPVLEEHKKALERPFLEYQETIIDFLEKYPHAEDDVKKFENSYDGSHGIFLFSMRIEDSSRRGEYYLSVLLDFIKVERKMFLYETIDAIDESKVMKPFHQRFLDNWIELNEQLFHPKVSSWKPAVLQELYTWIQNSNDRSVSLMRRLGSIPASSSIAKIMEARFEGDEVFLSDMEMFYKEDWPVLTSLNRLYMCPIFSFVVRPLITGTHYVKIDRGDDDECMAIRKEMINLLCVSSDNYREEELFTLGVRIVEKSCVKAKARYIMAEYNIRETLWELVALFLWDFGDEFTMDVERVWFEEHWPPWKADLDKRFEELISHLSDINASRTFTYVQVLETVCEPIADWELTKKRRSAILPSNKSFDVHECAKLFVDDLE